MRTFSLAVAALVAALSFAAPAFSQDSNAATAASAKSCEVLVKETVEITNSSDMSTTEALDQAGLISQMVAQKCDPKALLDALADGRARYGFSTEGAHDLPKICATSREVTKHYLAELEVLQKRPLWMRDLNREMKLVAVNTFHFSFRMYVGCWNLPLTEEMLNDPR